MELQLPSWFYLVLPPVLGIIIGYVTNAIAIKMLFRPLYEKRIFGIRLPFTPGIIPRQRGKLASSFGRMVSQRLLTVETIREHLSRPQLQEALLSNLHGALDHQSRLPLKEVLPPLFKGGEGGLGGYLTGEDFKPFFLRLAQPLGEHFWHKTLEDLFPKKPKTKRKSSEENLIKFQEGINGWLAHLEEKNLPLGGAIGSPAWEALEEAFRGAYFPLAKAMLAWLSKPQVRTILEERGRVFLSQVIQKLNGFQRFLVSTVQYDKTLDEEMPRLVEDVIRNLNDFLHHDSTRDELVQTLFGGVKTWLSTPWKEIPEDKRAAFRGRIQKVLESGFSLLGQKGDGEGPWAHFWANMKARPLGDLLEEYFSLGREEIGEKLWDLWNRGMDGALGNEESWQNWGEKSLQEIYPLGEEDLRKISKSLLDLGLEKIDPILEKAIAGLDVQGMVENKINALDLEQVEQLLLMVIKNHLKYINVFGGILGGIIGGLQTVMLLMG